VQRFSVEAPARWLGLLGAAALAAACADVRPPVASYPTDGATTPLSAPPPADPAAEPVAYSEDTAEDMSDEPSESEGDGAEDDPEHAHDPDDPEDQDEDDDAFLDCLDRGPGSPPHCPQFTWKSPIEGLSAEEIRTKVKEDLASIGPISVGAPNRGRLFNGVQMPKSDRWKQNDPGNAWGTQETVDSITRAVDRVHAAHKDTPPLIIGHISAKGGGRLRPHKSHQSGRDVDLSYFYNEPKTWYAVATDKNLDKPRTWTLVKAFLEDPNTEMVLIDTSLQKVLMAHALAAGEDKAFVERVFQVSGKAKAPLIRHAKGHATHIHVRFFSPSAQASGKLAAAFLPKPPPPPARKPGKTPGKGGEGKGKAGDRSAKGGKSKERADEATFVYHRARSGDTLDALSRKYAVSIPAIKQANGLKSNDLKINKTYRIPKK
jgi:penicillin-insensitive murein endopeptidase